VVQPIEPQENTTLNTKNTTLAQGETKISFAVDLANHGLGFDGTWMY
jgi:hypothetical protein